MHNSTIYMVPFSPRIKQRKQFYYCKANDLGVVWCGVADESFTEAC